MDILINVVNQKLKIATNLKSLVSGTQNFIRFVFNTSGEWDSLVMFAQFVQNGIAYNQYLDDNRSVYLPSEISAGTFTMMLYGNNETVIGTTNYLTLTVDENILISDAQSTDISSSLYDQLVTKVNSFIAYNEQKISDIVSANDRFEQKISQKVDVSDLAEEIERAKSAEKTNSDAIALKANQTDMDKISDKLKEIEGNGISSDKIKEVISEYLIENPVENNINAIKKTEEMTAEVGIDENGKLWFDPRAWEALDITQFSVTPSGYVEKGTVIDKITVSWKANKSNVEANLIVSGAGKNFEERYSPENGGSGKTVTLTELNLSYSSVTGNMPYVDIMVYNPDTPKIFAQRTQVINFVNRIFMGAEVNPNDTDAITSSLILSLSQSKLSASRGMTATVNADKGKYIWYACPETMGTPSFYVGGFEGGFERIATNFPFTNRNGYTENYQVWRSVRTGLGTTTVEVR